MSWIEWLESRRLITAAPGDTAAVAARRMAEGRVGALLVVDGDELVGILSERDLVRRVLAEGIDPETVSVGSLCTRQTHNVSETAGVSECARLMDEHGFRHVPVVDGDGKPVGMISSRDFLRFVVGELEGLIEKAYREQKIEELTDPYGALSV